MSGLLVAGTTSDAGKGVVTTGLRRAFARRGVKVAPYKAQNMSNNSMVCVAADGRAAEIGRAQWVQGHAACLTPEPAMNPVLLKPGSDRRSHVVLMGQPAGDVSSSEWETGRQHLAQAAHAAYDDWPSRFEIVVADGAGSPAEINLRVGGYVNMGLARHAGLPTVVVGDIDRGGVFAAMFGTVALLEPADQRLIAGFVVHKFRGDIGLLSPGLSSLASLTGRRVYGVLPWDSRVWLDSEDALDLEGRRAGTTAARKVAVVQLPRISIFTDLDALGLEPELDVVFVADPRDLTGADLVVLPGTRATISDLAWLHSRGLSRAIIEHAKRGRPVFGICGAFQMLGRRITDPHGVGGEPDVSAAGLGLLDVSTELAVGKVLRLGESFLGGARAEVVFGTMWHGRLEGDEFRRAFLSSALGLTPSSVSFPEARERRLELLGALVEEHLVVKVLLDLSRSGAPADVPALPPGGAS